MSSAEYLEIFKNTYFEAETLENEIYVIHWSHTLFARKNTEGMLKLSYSKRNMVQCKILIQLFSILETKVPPTPTKFGW